MRNTDQDRVPFVLGYLALGLGVGVAMSWLLVPKSGEETRKLIATKCLDVLDTANEKIRMSRIRVIGAMEKHQEQIKQAIAEGRRKVA